MYIYCIYTCTIYQYINISIYCRASLRFDHFSLHMATIVSEFCAPKSINRCQMEGIWCVYTRETHQCLKVHGSCCMVLPKWRRSIPFLPRTCWRRFFHSGMTWQIWTVQAWTRVLHCPFWSFCLAVSGLTDARFQDIFSISCTCNAETESFNFLA